MADYTINGTCTLPSEGKVYDMVVDPQIKLRSMSTNDEMKRLSPTDTPYKTLCDIIDDCTLSSPGISSYDMCLGDYQFLLYKLREVTYGRNYPLSNYCPYCGCKNTATLDLEILPIKKYNKEDFEKYSTFKLPASNKTVTLRPQTPRILDRIDAQVKEFQKKTGDKTLNPEILFSITNLVETIDGREPNLVTFEQWVRDLPMMDTNYILTYGQKLNNLIGIDTDLQMECETCGLEYDTFLQTTLEFFRPALDI